MPTMNRDAWNVLIRRIQWLTANSPDHGSNGRITFSLTTAAELAAESAGRKVALGLGTDEVVEMLGPDSAPFEYQVFAVMRVSSFELSDDPRRTLFVELAWALLATVRSADFSPALAAILTCCHGENEWRPVVDLLGRRVYGDLFDEDPEWERRGPPWPVAYQWLRDQYEDLLSAWPGRHAPRLQGHLRRRC